MAAAVSSPLSPSLRYSPAEEAVSLDLGAQIASESRREMRHVVTGVGFAFAIEAFAGLLLYAAWHLIHF